MRRTREPIRVAKLAIGALQCAQNAQPPRTAMLPFMLYITAHMLEYTGGHMHDTTNNCCNENMELHNYKKMLKIIKNLDPNLDSRVINSCIVYLDDFEKNEPEKFKEKII